MKNLKIILLLLGCLESIYAQQRPHYVQYLQNNFLINPAVAGIENYADARVGYRQQWIGIDAAPRTFYLTAHLPIGNDEFEMKTASPRFYQPSAYQYSIMPAAHAGLGLTLVQDQAGPWRQFLVGFTGAYHYPINDFWQISAGLQAGLTQHTFDFDYIKLANANDPALGSGKVVAFRPDLNAGVWVYSSDFFAGFSIQQLLNSKINTYQSGYKDQNRLVPHYFLTAGYRLFITDDWSFTPTIMLKKATHLPLTGDLNLKINYVDNLWFGISYRQKDAFVGWIGTRFAQKFRVNYSYEYPISAMRFQTTGSHELTLGLTLGDIHRYSSPRTFW